tara:strand:- start:1222 stop:1824 length:603 start_codon:yes stop_codon:yes gene_type:complete
MIFKIFPEIVYKDNLNIESYDISNINFSENDQRYSTDDNILDKDAFADIKKQINFHVKKFTSDILKISKDLKFYVTRSWLINIDKAHPSGFFHDHQNSFFTGVLYLNLDEGTDSISFQKRYNYQHLKYTYEFSNEYNEEKINYFPKKNDLIMFDARLEHSMGTHTTTNPRLCLAFEVFAKGTFGKHQKERSFNKGRLTIS